VKPPSKERRVIARGKRGIKKTYIWPREGVSLSARENKKVLFQAKRRDPVDEKTIGGGGGWEHSLSPGQAS